ncbi:MAG: hypothetical protein ACKO96_12975, partial [Flammeovirgaceae bacterium]
SIGDPIAQELLGLLPEFKFDYELLSFDLQNEQNPIHAAEQITDILRVAFNEFVSVSQVLTLSKALQVNSLSDLKQKLCLPNT